jgi:hypothetical protein
MIRRFEPEDAEALAVLLDEDVVPNRWPVESGLERDRVPARPR